MYHGGLKSKLNSPTNGLYLSDRWAYVTYQVYCSHNLRRYAELPFQFAMSYIPFTLQDKYAINKETCLRMFGDKSPSDTVMFTGKPAFFPIAVDFSLL